MAVKRPGPPIHAHPGQSYISPEDEERYLEVFKRLDKNRDGVIDIDELIEVFSDEEMTGVTKGLDNRAERVKLQAQKFLAKADYEQDRQVSLLEFLQYCAEREKTLKLTFNNLDKDDDGKISTEDLRKHFHSLGASVKDVNRVMRAMDKDGSLEVNFDEFKDFFLDTSHIIYSEMGEFFDSITSHALDVGTEDVLIREELPKKDRIPGEWWRHLVAGSCAGATSRTCTAPLDRLRVFLQVHANKQNGLNIYSAFRHMLEEGGYLSLWRGNGVNVMKIMPEMALRFYSYEYAKRLFKPDYQTDLKFHQRLLAGACAGVISQTVIYPLEVLKTRLLLRKSGQFSGFRDCCLQMLRKEGPLSFYKGYVPNILGIIPYAGVDLAVYETLKRSYLKRLDKKEPEVLVVLACGMTSSTMGQLVSYPLALVRTKLQAQVVGKRMRESVIKLNPSLVSGNPGLVSSSGIYRGQIPILHPQPPSGDTMVSLFHRIWKQDGLPGFYRGIFPNMMKVMPAVGISYVAYEQVRQVLGASMS